MTAEEIRTLLKLKGWSQTDLANELGVHRSAVSMWVSGDRTPTSSAAKTLRRLLDEATGGSQQKDVAAAAK